MNKQNLKVGVEVQVAGARSKPAVVVGVYPHRNDKLSFPVSLKLVDGKLVERNGLYLGAQVTTGFMRIKREVAEHFAARSPTYGWPQPDGSIKTVFAVFDRGVQGGEFVGEDMQFSRRCEADGIEVWVDPTVNFSHRGTKAWEGCFKPSLDHLLLQQPGLVVPAPGVAA